MTAIERAPRAESRTILELFLIVSLPTTQIMPATVTSAPLAMMVSQLIFFGPIVTVPLIVYGQGELIVPPASASASHSSRVSSLMGKLVVGLSALPG